MSFEPRIYVASLSDYNAGRLHGTWIDAAQDVELIRKSITEMLAESREDIAEEWAIHDYEDFGGIALGESEDIAHVAKLAELLNEHGEAFAAFYNNDAHRYSKLEHEDLNTAFEDAYRGEWDSLASYAEELGFVPQDVSWPLTCIDWGRAGRELEIGGDIWTSEAAAGRLFVFDGCS